MENKTTLVIGASENTERYSYKAIVQLLKHKHLVEAISIKKGSVQGVAFHTNLPALPSIDTVTLYVGPKHQAAYYDYVIALKPRRVIFNPGTENPEFSALLQQQDIISLEACTLVMLSIGVY